MTKRETIGKKIRFEVFKRDKFTCQYCGEKAPEVVLNVDHIDPVANGGTNEMLNLITSCFSCNSGKSDRILTDSSIVEKQRKQLELLEERREQIELMLEWKKSLSNFENDVVDMITDYVNSKIQPLSINENGKLSVEKWLKKFDTEKILDAVDISAKQYLKFENGKLDEESAELFLNKIGGVLVVKNLPPIKQKLAYIKGIARNRFSYWDDKKGSILLSNYVSELEKHYNEEQILSDLENELSKITKNAQNWSVWKDKIEKWTSEIQNWEVKSEQSPQKKIDKEYSLDELEDFVKYNSYEQNNIIKALEHLASKFPNFEARGFRHSLYSSLVKFLMLQNDTELKETTYNEAKEYIDQHILLIETIKYFEFDLDNSDNFGILLVLKPIVEEILTDIFMCCYYPIKPISNKHKDKLIEINIKHLEQK